MKNKIIILTFLCLAFFLIGQSQDSRNDTNKKCRLFSQVKFSKKQSVLKRDTVVQLISIGKILEKDRRRLIDIFRGKKSKQTSFKYAIEFAEPDCDKIYYLPCQDKAMSNTLYELINRNKKFKIKIRCVLIKEYFNEKSDFFYVEKVSVIE